MHFDDHRITTNMFVEHIFGFVIHKRICCESMSDKIRGG